MALWLFKMNFKTSSIPFGLALWLLWGLMSSSALASESSFRKARPLIIPGESPHLYLVPNGWSINPFVNDLWGDTDKLLTGGANIRYLSDAWGGSLHSSLNWRFFVPDNEPKHGAKKLDPAPGHYADWISLQTSWAKPFEFDQELFKVQLTGGLAHIGDHGAGEVHSFMHRLIGADLKNVSYENQPEGYNAEYGAELAWIPGFMNQSGSPYEHQVAVGESRYKVLSERWLSWNSLYRDTGSWTYGLELRFIQQFSSDTFQEYKDFRHEMSFGIKFSEYYTPSILYVSPYMNGDRYGQIYVSLFSFNIPL